MTRIQRPALLALALMVLSLPAAGAESPTSGACDSTGVLVCVGADVGASVACGLDATGLATCSWTYGWVTTGYSPAQLPGHENDTVTTLVRICPGNGPCQDATTVATHGCAWTPVAGCDHSSSPPGGSTTAQLALGECLTVEVQMSVDVAGVVVEGGPALAHAAFHNAGGNGGAVCRVDDGR